MENNEKRFGYPLLTVANAFIQKGIDEGSPIDSIRLNNYILLAHGFSLAVLEKPLINEHFEYDWRSPLPILKELRKHTLFHGIEPIEELLPEPFGLGSKWFWHSAPETSNEFKFLVDFIWDEYSSIRDGHLSSIIHEIASHVCISTHMSRYIPNESLKKYFKENLISPSSQLPTSESQNTPESQTYSGNG